MTMRNVDVHVAQGHDSSIVVEITTIILSGEDCNKLLVLAKESITVFHDLMSSADQIKIMFVQKYAKSRRFGKMISGFDLDFLSTKLH